MANQASSHLSIINILMVRIKYFEAACLGGYQDSSIVYQSQSSKLFGIKTILKFMLSVIYSCPMKTHHSSDVHICGLSKAVQICVIYNYYLGQMRCFRTKISISVTRLAHDVTSASKLR